MSVMVYITAIIKTYNNNNNQQADYGQKSFFKLFNYISLNKKYLPMRIGTSEEGGEGVKFRHKNTGYI